jgi:hypothetical protein
VSDYVVQNDFTSHKDGKSRHYINVGSEMFTVLSLLRVASDVRKVSEVWKFCKFPVVTLRCVSVDYIKINIRTASHRE